MELTNPMWQMMSRPSYKLGHHGLAVEQSTEKPEEDACFSTYVQTRNNPLYQHLWTIAR